MLFIVILVIAAILICVRVLLDPLAAHFTRKALHEANGIDGRLASVHVGIFPPRYTIYDLKVIEAPGGNWDHPLLDADDVRLDLNWRRLVHGLISAQMRVDAPKIHYTNYQKAQAAPPKPKPKIPNPRVELSQLIPARVDRIEVRDGEFLFRDATLPGKPAIGLHRIEVAAENVATRRRLSSGQPATVSMSALLGQSGAVRAFVSSDLFAKSLTAAGNAELRGWHVAELYAFEEPTTKLETTHGTIDLFAEFKIENKVISGGVKPVL
ncbi:MAG TPA: DUF748 domain-containing protein, partial [Polyangiaceae bacterium]|nr:DUF748 domain-containing protein [Polyangiaceae bacterium]